MALSLWFCCWKHFAFGFFCCYSILGILSNLRNIHLCDINQAACLIFLFTHSAFYSNWLLWGNLGLPSTISLFIEIWIFFVSFWVLILNFCFQQPDNPYKELTQLIFTSLMLDFLTFSYKSSPPSCRFNTAYVHSAVPSRWNHPNDSKALLFRPSFS